MDTPAQTGSNWAQYTSTLFHMPMELNKHSYLRGSRLPPDPSKEKPPLCGLASGQGHRTVVPLPPVHVEEPKGTPEA